MINIDFNGFKEVFFSPSLINISFNINKKSKEEIIHKSEDIIVKKEYCDYKTTLGGWGLNEIKKFNEDITVYLFIQKFKTSSAWNLVAPFVQGDRTNKNIQYGLGYFALEGLGGGIGNTDMLMFHLHNHKKKNYKVNIIPLVIENELLSDFEFVDSGVTLSNLLENSIPLINYRKDSFDWIYNQYNKLIDEYELE